MSYTELTVWTRGIILTVSSIYIVRGAWLLWRFATG